MPTSHFYVSGPAQVALGISGGTMLYLGYSERGVRVTEQLMMHPVFADFAGPMMPADKMVAGKTMTMSMELVWFNPTVFQMALSRISGGTMGGFAFNELGTLVYTEQRTFHIMVKAARQPTVPAYAANLPGINVPFGFFQDAITMPFSMDVQKLPLTFWANTNIDPILLNGTCWDTNMAGFPAVS